MEKKVEKRNWQDQQSKYFTMYRTTAHSNTGDILSEMIFNGKYGLPLTLHSMIKRTWTRKNCDRDAEKKGIADEIIQAKEIDIAEGDKVLLNSDVKTCRQLLPSYFEADPYEVVSKKGNIGGTVQKNGKSYKRSVFLVKKDREPISDDNQKIIHGKTCITSHINPRL